MALPDGIILTWYGDDFTGAAAVMEVLTFSGLPAVLFLDTPTQAQLEQFPDARALGVASTARTHSPAWMADNLPSVFSTLGELSHGIVHYKVCTTLDSSASVGSIGKAIEIGAEVLQCHCVPVLIAAPQMRRFQFYGHLFASIGDRTYRLDRHPVMSRHPVTPIAESDVARHIEAQSESISMDCIDVDKIKNTAKALKVIEELDQSQLSGLTLDSIDAESETAAGALIWEAQRTCRFVVGSQGVEYALIRHWQEQGWIPDTYVETGIGATDRMAVVSGSVSQITEDQINWSCNNGFTPLRFDALAALGNEQDLTREIANVVAQAVELIKQEHIPLVFAARGSDDPVFQAVKSRIQSENLDSHQINRRLGQSLGEVLQQIIQQTGIRRAVISGGDTSGYATQQLGIFALTALAPTIPGASLFKAHAEGNMDGLEIALKGGQMGSTDYFARIRDGGGTR